MTYQLHTVLNFSECDIIVWKVPKGDGELVLLREREPRTIWLPCLQRLTVTLRIEHRRIIRSVLYIHTVRQSEPILR